jgi:hypothetical protein
MTTLYTTGTPDGRPLIGGVWRLYHQDGFPIEMSWITARDGNASIDWMEAMADASTTNNLPALYDAMKQFLPADELTAICARFGVMASIGYETILNRKRKKQ